MKKVFIITGTARSGSTLLSLMLANDKRGFSVGELIHIMRPNAHAELFRDRTCFCSDPGCTFWKEISQAGEKHVYSTIFERYNDIDFIVDSSKRYLWLKDQLKYSKEKDYKVIPIITYKTPLEFAYSKAKRNNINGWEKGWVKEYRALFSLLDDFIAIKYQDLAREPEKKLEMLCSEIDISYFDGKENFWNNDSSHALFGSDSVKNSNKLIYYDEQYDKEKMVDLKNKLDVDNDLLKNIEKVLDAFNVNQRNTVPASIHSLKSELAINPVLSNFVYRLQATPYYRINKPMFVFTQQLLKLRKKFK